MELKDFIGESIKHNKNGMTGKIVSFNDEGTICTASMSDGKNHPYTTAVFINGLVSIEDSAKQDMIKGIINDNSAKAQAEAKAKADAKAAQKAAAVQAAKDAAEAAKIVGMFGPDYHAEHLRTFPRVTYQHVEAEFGIKIAVRGCGINVKDDSIVLISSMDKKGGKFVYHDRWEAKDIYIYSGEGSKGDQQYTGGNKEIRDAKKNGKKIYLLVKISSTDYIYQGIYECTGTWTEDAKDADGVLRKEIKFRLEKVGF